MGECKVLVVEDEPLTREMMVEVLRDKGYAVEAAADGAEALAVFQRDRGSPRHLSLVLLDLMLPEVSGLEVLRRLPKLGVRAPVVATSSNGQALAAAVAAGVRYILPKPFQPDDLLAVVGRNCVPPWGQALHRVGAARRHGRVRSWFGARRRAPLPHAPRCRLAAKYVTGRLLQRLERSGRALDVELSLLEALFRCGRLLPYTS